MSLAIAYAMKKKRKHECHGDMMAEGGEPMDAFAKGVKDAFSGPQAKSAEASPSPQKMQMQPMDKNPSTSNMKKAFHTPGYAKGGDVKGVHKEHRASVGGHHGQSKAGDQTRWANAMSYSGDPVMANIHNNRAKDEHKKVREEMKSMKGHDRKYLAEGGEVAEEMESGYEDMPMPCENCGHTASHAVENQHVGTEEEMEDGMIERIMSKRKHFSKGGRVANDTEPMADSEEADYDDLVKDDDLDFHYTGKNSGDEDGDKAEDEDRKDVVSRIMKSRKKKDRMPHPA